MVVFVKIGDVGVEKPIPVFVLSGTDAMIGRD